LSPTKKEPVRFIRRQSQYVFGKQASEQQEQLYLIDLEPLITRYAVDSSRMPEIAPVVSAFRDLDARMLNSAILHGQPDAAQKLDMKLKQAVSVIPLTHPVRKQLLHEYLGWFFEPEQE
jgi:hypothetical protein